MVAPVQIQPQVRAGESAGVRPPAWGTLFPQFESLHDAIPPLENGDRLTRREFERRYTAMPHLKKAELIEGTVYIPSPVRIDFHAQPHSFVITWLGVYYAATPNLILGDNATVRLDADNEVQPDALLMVAHGGQARVDEDGYISGAPELVVEIASSSASYDLHEKLNVYRRCGVAEYLAWRTREAALDWWTLKDGVYQPLPADDSGVIASLTFPGLCLNAKALVQGDAAAVLATQQQHLMQADHIHFIDRLKEMRS